MKTTDKGTPKTQELKLELLPESMNDDHYDGVIYISRRTRLPGNNPKPQLRKNRRHACQVFRFD